MADTISALLGLDLSLCNQDLVLVVLSVFLLLSVTFVYQVLMFLVGFLGGKRR